MPPPSRPASAPSTSSAWRVLSATDRGVEQRAPLRFQIGARPGARHAASAYSSPRRSRGEREHLGERGGGGERRRDRSSAICTTIGRQAICGQTGPPCSSTRSAVRTASPGWRLLAMIAAHDTGRPRCFGQRRRLVHVEVRAPGRLEVAGAALAHRLGELGQLGHGRGAARAPACRTRRRGSASARSRSRPRRRAIPSSTSARIARDLVGRRFALGRVVAHHVVPQRACGRAARRRSAAAAARRSRRGTRGTSRTSTGCPRPSASYGMPSTFSSTRIIVDRCSGAGRGDAEPAVAGDHGRHAVPRRRGGVGVPEQLRVVVGVGVDEPGRQHQAVEVDHRHVGRDVGPVADRLDHPVGHQHVGRRSGSPVPSTTRAPRSTNLCTIELPR